MDVETPHEPRRGARQRVRRIRMLMAIAVRRLSRLHPSKLVVLGYSSYILAGAALLSLPLAQTAGVATDFLDNLFIATSAVSTTGLVTVSVSDNYTFFGELVVLILIQLGGIGYMTLGSFLILARKTDLPEVRTTVGAAVFSLPPDFRLGEFIRRVIQFTLIIETIGMLVLLAIFTRAGIDNPLWSAIFHSVSAFCTAGFSLYNTSFEGFAGDFWLNATIATLSYLGAIGFIVWVDVARLAARRAQSLTLTSKIILAGTFWLSVIGTALFFIAEPSIQHLSPERRLLAAGFQCMTSITTVGFNTVSISELSRASVLVVVLFMVIGASPSGTGGGVKVTTASAVLGVMRSSLRGDQQVTFWGRIVPYERIMLAFGSLGFYVLALMIGGYLLELVENNPFEHNLFEAASALGTVGLSMGITAGLTNLGKIIIIILMLCGRIGPLTFGSALLGRAFRQAETTKGDLAI